MTTPATGTVAADHGQHYDAPPAPPDPFVRNLGAIGLLATVVLWWTAWYTDLFPEVGTFLALGGVLSWSAFVVKALSDDRVKQLQEAVDTRVLANPSTWKTALAVLGLFNLTLFTTTTVELTGDGVERTFSLTAGEDARPLPAKGTVRRLVFHLPLMTPELEVRVSGYPSKRSSGSRWWMFKTSVSVPESFLKPVVLIYPKPDTAIELFRAPAEAPVTVRQVRAGNVVNEASITGYRGEAIWIGSEADTDIPEHVRVHWEAQNREATAIWLRSRAMPWELVEDDDLEITMKAVTKSVRVQRASTFARFPQLEMAR